jgi:hypothetical protein
VAVYFRFYAFDGTSCPRPGFVLTFSRNGHSVPTHRADDFSLPHTPEDWRGASA